MYNPLTIVQVYGIKPSLSDGRKIVDAPLAYIQFGVLKNKFSAAAIIRIVSWGSRTNFTGNPKTTSPNKWNIVFKDSI